MGLVGLIPKIVNYGTKAVKYGIKGAKTAPNIIFGNGADAFVKGAKGVSKTAGKSWISAGWEALKAGGKAAQASAKGNVFKTMLSEIKTIPKVLFNYTKAGVRLAGKKGTSKLAGGAKGFFRGFGKKMPLINNLFMVAFELPNIVKATKEKGLGAGVAETAKAGVRLTAASIGSVALAGILPPLGAIAGWGLGDWLARKVVGKSYSEKKAEQEQQMQEMQEQIAQNQTQTQQQPAYDQSNPYNQYNPFNPYQTNPFANPNSRYYDDIMMSGYNFNSYA